MRPNIFRFTGHGYWTVQGRARLTFAHPSPGCMNPVKWKRSHRNRIRCILIGAPTNISRPPHIIFTSMVRKFRRHSIHTTNQTTGNRSFSIPRSFQWDTPRNHKNSVRLTEKPDSTDIRPKTGLTKDCQYPIHYTSSATFIYGTNPYPVLYLLRKYAAFSYSLARTAF